jgi:hypothetical protein
MMALRTLTLLMIATVWFVARAEAQTPCAELLRLRNAASEAWRQAMKVSPSERCEALNHASMAADATLNYANDNRESCHVSTALLNSVEGYHRQASQARDNVCAGRPLRPYPAEIIRH